MNLAETQALFHELLTGPEPVAKERVERCFAGTAAFPAEERVAIYADMYLWRLTDALRETFPDVARFLGDERFAALAAAYVAAHPSDHHDLGRLGRRLAEFLRAYPDPERPDLADLAELEWARQEVFFAPPAETVGADALAGMAPEVFAETRLALSPALRIAVLEYDAPRLWRALEAGGTPDAAREGPSAVAVWRSGFEVFHADLPAHEADALRAAGDGEPLGAVCAHFSDRAEPAAEAHRALSSWFAEGWIVGLGR